MRCLGVQVDTPQQMVEWSDGPQREALSEKQGRGAAPAHVPEGCLPREEDCVGVGRSVQPLGSGPRERLCQGKLEQVSCLESGLGQGSSGLQRVGMPSEAGKPGCVLAHSLLHGLDLSSAAVGISTMLLPLPLNLCLFSPAHRATVCPLLL